MLDGKETNGGYSHHFYRKMKYQTEYQRNFQKRTPRKIDDFKTEERRLNEVPIRRASSLSPSRRRGGRSLPSSPNRNKNNFAVIGPNEKFSNSHLYRLREPIRDTSRVSKPREYAILGRNEKFQDNAIYRLRKPVVDDDSSRNQGRRHKSDNHSCGIQTELQRAPFVSFDPQYGREPAPARNRIGPQSEYQQQYHWKEPLGDPVSDQMLVEDAKVRDRRSDPALPLTVIDPSEKLIAEKPAPPSRVEFDLDRTRQPVTRVLPQPIPSTQLKQDKISEYQSRYKPFVDQKKPRTRKAFEAEQAEERKQKELANAEHAHTDDEGTGGNVNLGNEFQQKHRQGNLRRWKSEYQTTYKPFWRFDYKNGKWYKDSAAEESGFNPNLFWYKELVSARKRADEYRTNAEADHFNRDHTLQLKTGQGGNKNYLAWDTHNDDDTDSVISIDRDVERARQNETKTQNDERIQSKIHYLHKQTERPTTANISRSDRIAPTDHQVDRVVYIDEPIPKVPSAATKALVRNLNSSSVQQHMSWDAESLDSQRTISEIDLHRKHYTNDESNALKKPSVIHQEHRSTGTHAPGYTSLLNEERAAQRPEIIRPTTSFQETRHAAGRASYDTHIYDKRPPTRPHSSLNDHSYQNHRYKDETTDSSYRQDYTPASTTAFQNQLNRLDERFGRTYDARPKDDDVLSINSARSLSSSCSLASQTLERAQQNMNKYWGGHSPSSIDSPKKPFSARN